MVSKYICAECGKDIQGEHPMAISEHWKGFEAPPPGAIVHVCSEQCEKNSKEFNRSFSRRPARR